MIQKTIRAFYGDFAGDPHHRYRSWEHCYEFFRKAGPSGIKAERKQAALQLAFYLASWGMYRGSAFLLNHAYTVHLGVVDAVASPKFARLWDRDIGSRADDFELAPLILEAKQTIYNQYSKFHPPTETLVTKVLLGTFACVPACDLNFVVGFRGAGLGGYSYFSERFINRVFDFARANISEFRAAQKTIKRDCGVHYPVMKVVDMYFFQLGLKARGLV